MDCSQENLGDGDGIVGRRTRQVRTRRCVGLVLVPVGLALVAASACSSESAPQATSRTSESTATTGPVAVTEPAVPPATEDCRTNNALAGWPTTTAPAPDAYACILDALATGTPAQMSAISGGRIRLAPEGDRLLIAATASRSPHGRHVETGCQHDSRCCRRKAIEQASPRPLHRRGLGCVCVRRRPRRHPPCRSLADPLLDASRTRCRRRPPASPRSAPHRCRPVDRGRRKPETDRRLGRTHISRRRPRPLRPPLRAFAAVRLPVAGLDSSIGQLSDVSHRVVLPLLRSSR